MVRSQSQQPRSILLDSSSSNIKKKNVVKPSRTRKQTRSLFSALLLFMAIKSNWELLKRSDGLLSSSTLEAFIAKEDEAPSFAMKKKTQHYYLHIPKVGGYAMQGFLSRKGAWVLNVGFGAPTKRQPIPKDYATWAKDNPDRSIIMSEGVGFNKKQSPPLHINSFVMFRNPQTHIVSQYFHCIESKDHRKLKTRRMPKSLLEWLQHWEGIRQNTSLVEQQSTDAYMNHWSDERYSCYNPINLQSWITGSYAESKQQLESKFDGIGILSQFHLSGCVFLATNLKRVPVTCNCTGMTTQDDMAQNRSLAQQSTVATTTATAVVSSLITSSTANATTTTTSSDGGNGTHKGHDFHDHGVARHGDSYEPSDEELQLILNLTRYDQMLYDTATEILHSQVSALEQQYHVTFCKSPPSPHDTPSSSSSNNPKRQMQMRGIQK